MLGYESREELMALDLARDVIQDPGSRARLLGRTGAKLVSIPSKWNGAEGPCHRQGPAQRTGSRHRTGRIGSLRAHRRRRHQAARAGGSPPSASRERSLTGLANYRRLVDVLDSEIKRSKPHKPGIRHVVFDLDGLKRINDSYGHMIGSQALCRLADVLCSCCRDIDTPARSVETSLLLSCRRPMQRRPVWWRGVSAKGLPAMVKDQNFPLALASPAIRKTAIRLRDS